jgi:hypothetical protein
METIKVEEIEIGKIVFCRGMMEYVYPITNTILPISISLLSNTSIFFSYHF